MLYHGIKMEDNLNEIYYSTWECRKLFERYHSIIGTQASWVEDSETQFSLWAYDIHADKVGHSSLDYRVRNRDDIRKVIVNLIEGISSGIDGLIEKGIYHLLSFFVRVLISVNIATVERPNGPLMTPLAVLQDEHQYYIETNLAMLQSLSYALRRSGLRLRHERADQALPFSPTSYNNLRRHLTTTLLVRAYEMEAIMALRRNGQHIVAMLLYAWARDPSRLGPIQQAIIDGVVTRRNRISFARNPWSTGHQEVPNQAAILSQETLQRTTSSKREAESSLSGDRTRRYHIGAASRSQRPRGQALQSTRLALHPRQLPQATFDYSTEPGSASANRVWRRSSSRTATEIGSSFLVPHLGGQEKNLGLLTELSHVDRLDYYPPRPRHLPGQKTFTCPYCCHQLPDDYLQTKSRWW